MNNQEFMNAVYDLLAQNNISKDEHNHITELIDYVDLDRNAIVFRTNKGKEFQLQLVDTYAPSNN
jgi:hypothetical protein